MHDREGAEQMEMIYNWILKLSFFCRAWKCDPADDTGSWIPKICPLSPGTDFGGNADCTGMELFDKRATFEEIYHDSAYKIRTSELEEKKSESSGRYSRYRWTERRESKHRKFGYGQPEYRGSDTRFEHRQEFR